MKTSDSNTPDMGGADTGVPEIDYTALAAPALLSDAGASNEGAAGTGGAAKHTDTDTGERKAGTGAPDAAAQLTAKQAEFRTGLQSRLAATMGADFKVPETVTPENYEDYLIRLGQERVQLHPEAARFQAALAAGKKPQDYFQELNAIPSRIAMDDNTLLTTTLRERYGKTDAKPDGWDEDKIKGTVQALESQGMLALQAEQVREGLRELQQKREQEAAKYSAPKGPDVASPEFVAELSKNVNADVVDILKETKGNLYGLDLSKAGDADKLSQRLTHLVKPDPKTGLSPFEQAMQSKGAYLKQVLLWDMVQKGAIKAEITAGKEAAKKSVLENLDLAPDTTGGGTRNEGDGIDLEALRRPAYLQG